MALHPVSPALTIVLPGELRRVLRNGGKLYVADSMRRWNRGRALSCVDYPINSAIKARLHSDGTWTGTVAKAGFTHVKRLQTVPEWHSCVTIMRARR